MRPQPLGTEEHREGEGSGASGSSDARRGRRGRGEPGRGQRFPSPGAFGDRRRALEGPRQVRLMLLDQATHFENYWSIVILPTTLGSRRAAAMVSESRGPGAGVPWRRSDEALRVNVGGVRRRLSARALARFPGTRLGRLQDSDTPSSVDPCPDEISDVQRELARYGAARCGRLRRRLWLTMENPGYSLPSKLFSCVSIGVVLASIAAMCIHSLPEYQAREAAACIAWFSFEVSSRLLLAPSTRNFFCHPLNLIDIVSVLPFYFTLVAGAALGNQGSASGEELGDLGKVVQVFRLMRIFRVLKLARHSTGLRSLGATLKHSYREVGILLLYLAVGVSVFSCVAYTAEKEEEVGFDTIPACWWWGTVSMTTVGYGDVVPVTVAGKLAASGCILGGILVVALPITIIFNKFSHFYRRQKALEAAVRNSGHREFEDLLSSVDGVSEASLETSHETSQGGRSADLQAQAPSGPPKSQIY
nr:PREDICTED: potassium voltage-gated channel subfamily S member 1 [Equus przewalskii]